MKVDFCTFCHKGDAHLLHYPGHLKRQVESNNFDFDEVWIIYQLCNYYDYPELEIRANQEIIEDLDLTLKAFGINLDGQYISDVDKAHHWKYHVVNHLAGLWHTNADYIVFADNDCWMKSQPENKSWVEVGIGVLEEYDNIFIVSPNDGEEGRITRRMSQQMFLVRVDDFRNMDFNQPGWDGNVNIPGGPMPEYWGMLEGRMEIWCNHINKFRYVMTPDYRYWHFNRINPETGYYETDYSKW